MQPLWADLRPQRCLHWYFNTHRVFLEYAFGWQTQYCTSCVRTLLDCTGQKCCIRIWSPPFHYFSWYNHCQCTYDQRKQHNVCKHLNLALGYSIISFTNIRAALHWGIYPYSDRGQKIISSPLSLYTDKLHLWQQSPSQLCTCWYNYIPLQKSRHPEGKTCYFALELACY